MPHSERQKPSTSTPLTRHLSSFFSDAQNERFIMSDFVFYLMYYTGVIFVVFVVAIVLIVTMFLTFFSIVGVFDRRIAARHDREAARIMEREEHISSLRKLNDDCTVEELHDAIIEEIRSTNSRVTNRKVRS